MKKRSLTILVIEVLTLCGLIIPHLGFAYPINQKRKILAKKAATVKSKNPVTKKPTKKMNPRRKVNPNHNARLKNKAYKPVVHKPVRQVKPKPIKPVQKDKNKNKVDKNKVEKIKMVAPKVTEELCLICAGEVLMKDAYKTECCKQDICITCAHTIYQNAYNAYNEDRNARCPYCRATPFQINKLYQQKDKKTEIDTDKDGFWRKKFLFDYNQYMQKHNYDRRRYALPFELHDQLIDNIHAEETARGRDPRTSPYDKEYANIALQELAKIEKQLNIAKAPKKDKKKKVVKSRKNKKKI